MWSVVVFEKYYNSFNKGWKLAYSVGIETAEVQFSAEAGHFSLLRSVQTGSGVHPASSYPIGKRPGRETDRSPSNAEVKNCGV
jgi:hypothetical protein